MVWVPHMLSDDWEQKLKADFEKKVSNLVERIVRERIFKYTQQFQTLTMHKVGAIAIGLPVDHPKVVRYEEEIIAVLMRLRDELTDTTSIFGLRDPKEDAKEVLASINKDMLGEV